MIKNSETVRGWLIKVDLSCRFDKEVLFISVHSLLDPRAARTVLSRAVLPGFPVPPGPGLCLEKVAGSVDSPSAPLPLA